MPSDVSCGNLFREKKKYSIELGGTNTYRIPFEFCMNYMFVEFKKITLQSRKSVCHKGSELLVLCKAAQ